MSCPTSVSTICIIYLHRLGISNQKLIIIHWFWKLLFKSVSTEVVYSSIDFMRVEGNNESYKLEWQNKVSRGTRWAPCWVSLNGTIFEINSAVNKYCCIHNCHLYCHSTVTLHIKPDLFYGTFMQELKYYITS